MPPPVSPAMNPASGRCRFGLFEFDFRTGELRRDGQIIKLSPQPSRVLALLLARPGELLLREDLRKALWGEDTFVDFERGLNFCILQVRAALGDSAENPRFVQTAPRKGYRFIAPVAFTSVPPAATSVPDSTSVPIAAAAQTAQDPPRGLSPFTAVAPPASEDPRGNPSSGSPVTALALPAIAEPAQGTHDLSHMNEGGQSPATAVASRARRGQSLVMAVAPIATAVAVLALIATGAWFVFRTPAPDPTATASTGRVRIAVLPFVNLSGDPGADYLADGLTDEVISQLGQLSPRGLAVIARTSAMTYRKTTKTVSDIGRELGVTFVVENSLRREGDSVRLASRLISVADETPVAQWSEMFGGAEATAANSHTSAAIRLARVIALELVPNAPANDVPRPTSDLAAWEAFLRGRTLMNASTADDVRRAIAHFESAVDHDPQFAAAWAKLAEARHVLVMMGALPPESAYPAARDAAQRALASDSNLADAHLAHGLVRLWYDWQPADAATSFQKAIDLNESLASAHHDYAWSLMALGRSAEAIAHITAARDLNPLSLRANNDIGWLHLQLRQPADAARACEHTLAIEPNSLEAQACLERAYAERGFYDAALRAARASLPPGVRKSATFDGGLDSEPHRSDADTAASGRTAADALRAMWHWRLTQLEEAARTRWISPYTIAVHHVLVGNLDRAVDHLEAALQQRVGMMVFLRQDPALDPLRGHPRFATLLKRMNEARR